MTISTFQEFHNLLSDIPISVITELSGCMNLLNKICPCKKSQRQSKNDECNNIYINFITNSKESLIEHLKLRTNDNEVTFKHNVHHEIATLKIR